MSTDASGLSKAIVVVKTNRGTVKFRFYSKDAPNTVKRFAELVQQKFYNGLSFHRVVPGFVVQTGDPKSRNKSDTSVGTGGSGQKLKAEFNGRRHVRGTVAMARSADPDSADSQFYFSLGTYPHLDNNYTIFGQVSDFGEKQDGADVLERIRQGDDLVEMHLE
ncbi:MAG: peptidylprolyl isomerase [Deltaproteobacteria bacterium]|nr:peptidylprolyl isomerase [Deltaproteobacteria bacterium]